MLKPKPAIWEGRIDDPNDPSTLRIHQIVKPANTREMSIQKGFSLIGYACDEGVKRNNGRPGAIEGPSHIRKALGSMAYHGHLPIYDHGDFQCLNQNMEETQNAYATEVCKALKTRQRVVGLGGGHDIAYGSYMGIKRYLKEANFEGRFGILNIDSHLDLRAPKNNTHSGTPFYQIALEESNEFSYCCFGIQEYGNTKKLLEQAKELFTIMVFRNEIRNNLGTSISQVEKFISAVDYLYLTIDLDAMDQSLCPGVSAPSVDGLLMAELTAVLDATISSKKIILLDIAENSPRLDEGGKTSRIAAYAVHKIINGKSER